MTGVTREDVRRQLNEARMRVAELEALESLMAEEDGYRGELEALAAKAVTLWPDASIEEEHGEFSIYLDDVRIRFLRDRCYEMYAPAYIEVDVLLDIKVRTVDEVKRVEGALYAYLDVKSKLEGLFGDELKVVPGDGEVDLYLG